jgi:hypothetical protein
MIRSYLVCVWLCVCVWLRSYLIINWSFWSLEGPLVIQQGPPSPTSMASPEVRSTHLQRPVSPSTVTTRTTWARCPKGPRVFEDKLEKSTYNPGKWWKMYGVWRSLTFEHFESTKIFDLESCFQISSGLTLMLRQVFHGRLQRDQPSRLGSLYLEHPCATKCHQKTPPNRPLKTVSARSCTPRRSQLASTEMGSFFLSIWKDCLFSSWQWETCLLRYLMLQKLHSSTI